MQYLKEWFSWVWYPPKEIDESTPLTEVERKKIADKRVETFEKQKELDKSLLALERLRRETSMMEEADKRYREYYKNTPLLRPK